MTLAPELFNAILAMDAYNRGYDAGINVLGGVSSYVGLAHIIYQSNIKNSSAEVNAGFYGVAYSYKGETIISYRGTDYPRVDTTPARDIYHGWSLGAGITESQQAQMAIRFYQAVAKADNSDFPIDPTKANIELVGHSLGGGLAGYVGSLYHKSATVFDSMTFARAVINTKNKSQETDVNYNKELHDLVYGPNKSVWESDESHINGYYMGGEILDLLLLAREGAAENHAPYALGITTRPDVAQNMDDTTKAIIDILLSELAGPVLGYLGSQLISYLNDKRLEGLALHSMPTLVIRMFADESEVKDKYWDFAAPYFWPALYDSDLAASIGYATDARVAGELQAQEQFADTMRAAIAYSAINEGTRVFGDTAIRALYNDANDLGRAIGPTGANQLVVRYATDISKILVQYAGQLALSKVRQDANEAVDEQQGLLTYSGSVRQLVIDLDAAKLRAANSGTLPALHSDALVDRIIASDVSTKPGFEAMLWSSVWEPLDRVGRIMFAPVVQALVTIAPFATPRDDVTIYVGANGVDRVLGSSGNDFLVGNAGNDVLSGGGGKDVIVGGAGFDTASFSGGPYPVYVNIRNADQGGYDVYRHIGSSNELIGLIYTSERIIGTSHIDVAEYGRSNSAVTVTPLAEASAGLRVQKTGGSIDTRNVEFVAFEGVDGSIYDDAMRGNNANNIFWGRVGRDTFLGSRGSDTFEGGGHTDTVDYSDLALNIDITTIDASLGNYRVRKYASGSVGTDRLFSIENLIGKKAPVFEQAGGEVISGTSSDDGLSPHSRPGSIAGPFTFRGLGGNDTLSGSEANDRFIGGRGDDVMQGGRGNDIFEYSKGDGNDRIQVNGNGNDGHQSDQLVFGAGIAPGDVTLTRDASEDVKITIAGSGTILLEGQLSFPLDFIRFANGTIWDMETMRVPVYGTESESGDVINGVREMLNAREGALVSDLIYGLGGDDSINAGSGENVVYGGAGNDWISGGIDRDILSGDAGNDFLAGNDQDDRLSGGDGDDELRGENGADTLLGQGGADDLTGGDGTDMLSGGAANDVLAGGLGNDTISGDAGNDRLTGDSGDDTLNGGSGNDTLDGGTGNDVLNGGTGRDRFEFTTNPGNDTIVGFEKAFDIINPQFSASFNEFTEMKISQKGADTIIDLGIYDLTLANYLAINLTESNFSFV